MLTDKTLTCPTVIPQGDHKVNHRGVHFGQNNFPRVIYRNNGHTMTSTMYGICESLRNRGRVTHRCKIFTFTDSPYSRVRYYGNRLCLFLVTIIGLALAHQSVICYTFSGLKIQLPLKLWLYIRWKYIGLTQLSQSIDHPDCIGVWHAGYALVSKCYWNADLTVTT